MSAGARQGGSENKGHKTVLNPLASDFFYFSTPCIQNVNNIGTKQVSIIKQTAF